MIHAVPAPVFFPSTNNARAEAPPLSYQFRIATLKILIEVGDAKHAIALAKQLMLEDDDNVEIWCVTGCRPETMKKTKDNHTTIHDVVQWV